MKVQENIPLSDLTTMRVGGVACWVLTCENRDDIVAAIDFADKKGKPWFVLGGGSNVVAGDDFDGVIILNRIKGFEKVSADEISETYRIGAGEVWDEAVAKLCAKDLSGVECLSLIPGCAGSTPVQNVGAYGQEISQTLTELTVFDTRDNSFKALLNSDCNFSYRNSIFKSQKDRHYIICDITLRLSRQFMQPPFYEALQRYLDKDNSASSSDLIRGSGENVYKEDSRDEHENDNRSFSPSEIRRAVIAIRDSKLPRVEELPSTGSFFKNPILSAEKAADFLQKFPDAPHWKMPENKVKFAAGWLIDTAGLKGYENYGFQLYPKNALVITNVAKQNSAENLAKFKADVVAKVRGKFGITLEQEPESL